MLLAAVCGPRWGRRRCRDRRSRGGFFGSGGSDNEGKRIDGRQMVRRFLRVVKRWEVRRREGRERHRRGRLRGGKVRSSIVCVIEIR